MPEINGIELANKILDLHIMTAIVFVTACNQYAVEAFHLNAIDYLLKPVAMERLKGTLSRIKIGKQSPTHQGGIQVKCFGKFSVCAGKEAVKFRTEKAEELFAFLLDNRGNYVSRSKIIDSLWEDFEGDRAIIHFNTTLHYVKKALLPYDIHINIMYDRGSYRLDMEGINCDYIQFIHMIKKTGIATRENILELEATASLYSDEYLSGWDFDWTAGKRLQLVEEYIKLLLEIANYYQQEGIYQSAAKWLKEGITQEPLHRELNYRQIEILLLSKERILANKYFEVYRTSMKKKLGLEPDEGFQKLFG